METALPGGAVHKDMNVRAVAELSPDERAALFDRDAGVGAVRADVHEEADRLEHHVSEELTDRIAETLDNPGVDPHGDPIPDADLELPDSEATGRLSAAEEGDSVVVRRIRHQGDEELRYLAAAGVEPGVELEVLEVAPFGLVTVETPAGQQGLPEEIAAIIETTPATGAEA